MEGGFSGVVDRAKDVRDLCSDAANVYDSSLCFDEKRVELFAHSHNRKDIGIECQLDLLKIDIQSWYGVIASPVRVSISDRPAFGACTHALLTRRSSLPPVRSSTYFLTAWIRLGSVTSRTTVSMPTAFKSSRASARRAVANTWRPGSLSAGIVEKSKNRNVPLEWKTLACCCQRRIFVTFFQMYQRMTDAPGTAAEDGVSN